MMVGQTIGHYRILDKLGEGGMGEVYRAEDLTLERQVALKVLSPELATNRERLERFQREARVLAALDHPNIVHVHSVESVEGLHFLTMELIEGETLAEIIPRNGMTLRDLFSTAIPMADALSKAHERGIVHRDFKPTNVMLTREGVVKVLDFGLAKIDIPEESHLDTEAATEALTDEGRILGTAPYMSPEQLKGESVDHRTDIFSLGIVLYQAATGHRPFGGGSSVELHTAILRDRPPAVDKVRRDVPHHLGRIINGCLEKNPEERYQSAKDVRNDLARLRTELTSGEVELPDPSQEPPVLNRHRIWAVAGLALLAVVALAVVVRVFWRPTSSEPPATWDDAPALSARALRSFEQAKDYERRGDLRTHLEHAEQLYRQALELEPNDPHIEAHLATLLVRFQLSHKDSGRMAEARELVPRALEAAPEESCSWLAQGYLQLHDHDDAGAEASAREAIARQPKNVRAQVLLSEAQHSMGEHEKALETLRSAADMEWGHVWARPTLARQLLTLNRLDEAAVEYKALLEVLPDSPNALNNLGAIQMWKKNYEEAAELFARSWRLQPGYMSAMNLGTAYFYMDRMQEAIDAYQDAYELEPDIGLVQANLGEAYEKIGADSLASYWYQSALEAYDREFAAGSPSAEKISSRAVCAAKLGRFDEAIGGVIEALATAENDQVEPDSMVLFNAAKVYALAERRSETLSFVEQAIAVDFPPQQFLDEPIFASIRDDPQFRAKLSREPAP